MNYFLRIHRFLLPQDHDVGYSAYVVLLFLGIFFSNFYFKPVHGLELLVVIIGVLTFLVCYFRAYWSSGKALYGYIVAICLIGTVMAEINWGASVFFVYAAAFTCDCGGRKNAFLTLAAIILYIIIFTLLTNKPEYFWVPAIFFSFIIGTLNIHQAEVNQKNRALRQSQEEIQLLAETAERERISRDLHDLLGHSLSVITLKSELAGKMIDKGVSLDKIKTEIKAVEQLSRDTLAQVRGAVRGYNIATIKGELLQAKVATEAANIELIDNIEVIHLPTKVESELALIIREAITNVIRHAESQKVWVTLKSEQDEIYLTVSDQGEMADVEEHSGLQNMRTRISKIGGEMKIQKMPFTQLQFIIPVI